MNLIIENFLSLFMTYIQENYLNKIFFSNNLNNYNFFITGCIYIIEFFTNFSKNIVLNCINFYVMSILILHLDYV